MAARIDVEAAFDMAPQTPDKYSDLKTVWMP
jgi:hypothetical protein